MVHFRSQFGLDYAAVPPVNWTSISKVGHLGWKKKESLAHLFLIRHTEDVSITDFL